MGIIFLIIFIVVLLATTVLLSGAETAITAASKNKIYSIQKQNQKINIKRIMQLKQMMGQTISTILIGNTIVNVVIASIFTAIFIEIFGDTGVAYSSIVAGMMIVYLEVCAKIYALQNPETLSIRVGSFLYNMVRLFKKIVVIIEIMSLKSMKTLGIYSSKNTIENDEELRASIDIFYQNTKQTKEKNMLTNILDMESTSVEDIMIHRKHTITINVNDPIYKIVNTILENPFTRFPLCNNDLDNVIGIVHTRDLLNIMIKGGKITHDTLKSITNPSTFIPSSVNSSDQLKLFLEQKQHFGVVVDEYGMSLGIITLEDLLEEIVGEITDENDMAIPGIKKLSDSSYCIMGTKTIKDINKELNWSINDKQASTLAGFIIHSTKKIPNVGQVFRFNNLKMEIMKKNKNQITMVKIIQTDK